MRRENPRWEYRRETSAYDKSDYRSKFYKGKWEKAWIKDRIQYASDKKIELYESMWEGYIDKTEHMPKSLFKFFPFNHNSLKCIETNSVFMNNPSNFNDPFDCLLCANENEFLKYCLLDYLKETDAVGREILSQDELNKLEHSYCGDWEQHNGSIYNTFDSVVTHICYDPELRKERKGSDEISRKIYYDRIKYENGLKELRKNTIQVTSFANINDFKLTSYMELWAHYAQNHEGFCVEYDLTRPIADSRENAMILGGLLPCEYGAKQIILSKRKIYKYINKIPLTAYEQMELDKSLMLSFITKSSSWKYENEWRLLLPVDICKIYDNMIPFFPIKAIYIGCRMHRDNREYLYCLAKRKDIKVYDMSMHEYNFELEGEYCETNINNYFQSKEEKRQKELRDSKYKFWK